MEMLRDWKKKCKTYSAICSSCAQLVRRFAFQKHVLPQNSESAAAGGLKNERTSEKNASETPERGELEEKNRREPQTKVKQGKIQRMKRRRRGEAGCW